jgi:16S rRNA (guanine(966)-N(2))-methyltransferase RsmD
MRIIAGKFRSRVLKTLPGLETRPTSDRLRESLFNILASEIEDCVFLDAYAGTGAVGIEALSRGARRGIFIERSRAAVGIIRENLTSLGIARRAEVLHGRTSQYLAQRPADIVFLDPPYDLEKEYGEALTLLGAGAMRVAIAQHASRFRLEERYGLLERKRTLKQGDNTLSFYRPVG